MLKLKEHFDEPFDFLIDGRIGTTKFYRSLFPGSVHSSCLGLDEDTPHEREHGYKCGIGTL